MLPVLQGIDPHLREAAATLGASPRHVWREIDLPIVSRAGLVAAGFAFAVTVGEFGATIFVARASHPTIPVAIYRALALPGQVNLGRAMALVRAARPDHRSSSSCSTAPVPSARSDASEMSRQHIGHGGETAAAARQSC
jgi:hypothetical protein